MMQLLMNKRNQKETPRCGKFLNSVVAKVTDIHHSILINSNPTWTIQLPRLVSFAAKKMRKVQTRIEDLDTMIPKLSDIQTVRIVAEIL